MSVKSVGGRSVVFNQLIPDSIIHVTVTIDEDVTEEKWLKQIVADTSPIARAIGHKVLGKCIRNTSNPNTYVTARFGNNNVNISNGNERQTTTENGIYTLSSRVGNPPPLYFRAFSGATAGTYGFTLQLFDLTAMFGSGNEPASVEEFEKIFPADYYPYNEGEIVSAGVTEVAVGGTAYPIPEAIKSLPGYGWSAGTAKNYVDYENKRYVQCVGRVDLGTLTWNIDQGIRWYTYVLPKYLTDKNAMCNKLIYSSNRELNDESKWINSGAGFFEICVANVTTSADVAAKMSGVILYYELATPIITDISTMIDDDFLRNISVEAGGTITFKNGNGDSYRIPVPSEEEYIVKLSEIGGTT